MSTILVEAKHAGKEPQAQTSSLDRSLTSQAPGGGLRLKQFSLG
jgi:hypothetical protein